MANSNVAETDFSSGGRYDLDHRNHEPEDALRKIQTAGSISISPELFEKIYLSPQNRVKGDIRQTFGNPTPIALGGFLLALTPLSNILLGWRHSGLFGASDIAAYLFFGGVLMIVGGVLEFVLGNTFPSVVFTTFGAFWLTYGGTLQPFYNAAQAYKPGPVADALLDPEFLASFGFFLAYMGVLCFVFLVASLRTNLVFFLIFLLLVPTFACLATAFWRFAEGNVPAGTNYKHAGGGMAFGVCLLGWYLFTIQILAAVDFPVNLPVVDLSTVIKGGSDRKRAKEAAKENGAHEEAGGRGLKFWKKS